MINIVDININHIQPVEVSFDAVEDLISFHKRTATGIAGFTTEHIIACRQCLYELWSHT